VEVHSKVYSIVYYYGLANSRGVYTVPYKNPGLTVPEDVSPGR
jgi:hypothetical protein